MGKVEYRTVLTPLKSPSGDWLVDPEMRSRLLSDAQAKGLSLNQMATKILAAKYNVEFVPTPKDTKATTDAEKLNLRLPTKLWKAIDQRTRRPLTVQDAVRASLSEHYGFRVPPKIKRRRVAA